MTDDEFVHAFLHGSLPPTEFHHRDHLRLAWKLTRELGETAAAQAVTNGIREFATRHGQAAKYHQTMTLFWVRIVGHMASARPDIAEFAAFLAAFPRLLDKDLPYRHWRRETMGSAAARAEWVEPDLIALPA
jgi:CDP-diacylglycerol--glycerol-3-phosphate 3-phosphatidyltransferase